MAMVMAETVSRPIAVTSASTTAWIFHNAFGSVLVSICCNAKIMKWSGGRHYGDERLVDYESSRHNFRYHNMRSSKCLVIVASLLVVIPEMERVGSEIASLATKRDLNH